MKIYNHFSSEEELNLYLRQEFYGTSRYCKTNHKEPFLEEIPIRLSFKSTEQMEKSQPDNHTSPTSYLLRRELKVGRNKLFEDIYLSSINLTINEDLAKWNQDGHCIQIQAMNSNKAFLIWKKNSSINNREEIFFQGVLHRKERTMFSLDRFFNLQKYRNL